MRFNAHSLSELDIPGNWEIILRQSFQKLLSDIEQHPVTRVGTIYTGDAGLALLYIHLAFQTPHIQEYLQKAENIVSQERHLHLHPRRIGFLEGSIGVGCLKIVCDFHLHRQINSHLLQTLLVAAVDADSDSNELLYGRSGLLYAFAFLRCYVAPLKQFCDHYIRILTHKILVDGKMDGQEAFHLQNAPLIWTWHSKLYLGAAHGIAGILETLIKHGDQEVISEYLADIARTVDWILNFQFETGNFPSSSISRTNDQLVQFCHGSPGIVPLLCDAARLFPHNAQKYNNAIELAAMDIWQRGLLKKGVGLCHGIGGNAFALLQVFNHTQDSKYLIFAIQFALYAANVDDLTAHGYLHVPDYPTSLFEGKAGLVWLLADLSHNHAVEKIGFPCFTGF